MEGHSFGGFRGEKDERRALPNNRFDALAPQNEDMFFS